MAKFNVNVDREYQEYDCPAPKDCSCSNKESDQTPWEIAGGIALPIGIVTGIAAGPVVGAVAWIVSGCVVGSCLALVWPRK